MRLYLSSYGFGNHPEKLLNLLGSGRRAAVICNAVDWHTLSERNDRVEQEIAWSKDLGIAAEELDLRDYFSDHAGLEDALKQYDLVWLRGGNTFILQRAITASGFDNAIKKLLATDSIVYGGYSAGACVATPTLQGLDIVDDPTIVPDGYSVPAPTQGMGLVDYSIAPHYKSDHPESADVDRTVDYFLHKNMPYKTLRDGEVLIVNDEREELVL